MHEKDSIINNFKKYQFKTFMLCIHSLNRSKKSKNVYYLNKKSFKKIQEKSLDYAILEKSKNINGIKLNIPWSDLGSWKEISNIFKKTDQNILKRAMFFINHGENILIYILEKDF